MLTITTTDAMRSASGRARAEGRRIGFVPTMGFLHEGHLSLVRRSRAECDVTVASIFVNPAQFGPGEDLGRYPRDLARDSALLEREGCDILFHPEAADLYRPGHATWVEVPSLSAGLCGAFRPGHFRGVATIVAKLFHLVGPDVAYFGQKDAQQAAILRRMTEDLDFGIRVEVVPTVRESDGLALSSRNVYLSPAERAEAPRLHRALERAREAVARGVRQSEDLRALVAAGLEGSALRLQYVEVVRADDLQPVRNVDGPTLIAAAAFLGATRLIDNVVLDVPPARDGE